MANSKVIGVGVGVLLLGAAATFGLSRGCSPVADHHDPILLVDAGPDGTNDARDEQALIIHAPSNTSQESTRVGCIGNDCPQGNQPVPQPDPARSPSMGGATAPQDPANIAPDPNAMDSGMMAPGTAPASPSTTAPSPSVANPPQAEQTRVGCIGNDCPQGNQPVPQPDPVHR
jgi:hypothetical protein